MNKRLPTRDAEPPRPARVAIVEDDTIVRDALVGCVRACADFCFVGAAESVREGLLLSAHDPDVWLIDLALPDGSGLEVIAAARARDAHCKLLVISVLGDTRSVLRAIEAGADGYLLKGADGPQVEHAIRAVLDGGAPISPAVAGHLLRRVRGEKRDTHASVRLTERELSVLEGLAKGLSFKEVAQAHGISHFTVGDHVKAIYKKLGVRSRGEAVFEALGARLIRVED